MLARDIMTPDVVVVPPEMPVEEVGALLVDHRIHGAPVVDDAGRLVGMVSLVDLVGRTGDTAADVMTPDPVCAGEETPVEEIAGMMLEQAIRRVPIVREGRVVGIISASDIIGLFLNLHEREPASHPSAHEPPGSSSRTRRIRRTRR
jgi:CBS domain-containing protein